MKGNVAGTEELMEQTLEKWYPYCNLDTMYDVHDVWIGTEGNSYWKPQMVEKTWD